MSNNIDLLATFTYHKPSDAVIADMEAIRQASLHLCQLIQNAVPDGREQSTSIRKVEEASMWANKGMVLHR